MSARSGPPRVACWLLGLTAPATERDAVLGDLEQEFRQLVASGTTRGAASRWYWSQVLRSTLSNLPRRGASLRRFIAGGANRALVQDVRVSVRALTRAPGFVATAVLSLAIGIGANTALFTIIQKMWFEPVPGVANPERVVEVLITRLGGEIPAWAYPDFIDVRNSATPIQELAAWKQRDGSITIAEGSETVRLMYVSSSYFPVLGVTPALGRGFLPSEDTPPVGQPVAVVSYAMWQNRLDGAADIIGRTIVVNRTSYTVIGVTPEEFRWHRTWNGGPEIWLPIVGHPLMAGAGSWGDKREALWVEVLGKLAPGASLDEANAALQAVFGRLELEYPESNEGRSARAAAFGPVPAAGRTQGVIALLSIVGLVGLVLLIISGNVAGMVLARNTKREREIAVRMALGSGRGRLVSHLMAEALVISLTGGALGILASFWTLEMVTAKYGLVLPGGAQPNASVLLASLALVFATALAFGLLPALRFSRPELLSSLKDDSGSGGQRVGRVHRIAASAQTGVALVFVIIGSLFARAAGVMETKDFGFEPDNLALTYLDVTVEGYSTAERGIPFIDQLRESLGSLPGVEFMSVGDGAPLDFVGNFTSVVRSEASDEANGRVAVEFTRVTEGFFDAIGARILRGRGIASDDEDSSQPVVVITRALAERLWPGEDAVGGNLDISLGTAGPRSYSVVGIVENTGQSRPSEDVPHIFVALRQNYSPRFVVVLRSTVDPALLAAPIQSAVLALDPSLPPPSVVTSESLVERATADQVTMVRMATGLGALALVLSAIGVYGVVAFSVANRTREIGLRMAMGATRSQVLTAVFRDAVRLALPGLVGGAFFAVAAATVMRSMLVGVSPIDPLSLLAASVVLLSVVLLAAAIPARRASGIDPMEALRYE